MGAAKRQQDTWLDTAAQKARDLPWWAKVGVAVVNPVVGIGLASGLAANDAAGQVNDKILKPLSDTPTPPPLPAPPPTAQPFDQTALNAAAQTRRRKNGLASTFLGGEPTYLGGTNKLGGQ